ncbi:hypothetical protein QJS10_CPB11g00042 [Acorus calamus]|uniref:Plant heme peroxidase family profile domain-containing protein n=1 Tax=Acorus calamus TaxID=4465 RepID=A0AAV9DUA0_ACOCL|nr:hypothetical protein QJS10_CPB11g00042 [Acorus calamus]
MALSFLSTATSLLPFPSHSHLPFSITPKHTNGSIRCHKAAEEFTASDGFRSDRRDFFRLCGTIVGTEVVANLGPLTGMASAADLIQRGQRSQFLTNIKGTFYTAIKGHPELIPSILTLALNDAITYDKATKTGGPNGSIRLSSELNRPENKGLSVAMNLLEEAKKEIDSYSKGGPISLQISSNLQWGLFDRQFGRSDSQEPDPEGRIPQWDKASVQEMKDKFSAIGFGPRQLAVMSAFLGPDQLATETLLASDPEVRPWVEKYQRSRETVSQTDYQVDLITTLTKLSSLGQQINYEAYTYPVKKVDFSKLKL